METTSFHRLPVTWYCRLTVCRIFEKIRYGAFCKKLCSKFNFVEIRSVIRGLKNCVICGLKNCVICGLKNCVIFHFPWPVCVKFGKRGIMLLSKFGIYRYCCKARCKWKFSHFFYFQLKKNSVKEMYSKCMGRIWVPWQWAQWNTHCILEGVN